MTPSYTSTSSSNNNTTTSRASQHGHSAKQVMGMTSASSSFALMRSKEKRERSAVNRETIETQGRRDAETTGRSADKREKNNNKKK